MNLSNKFIYSGDIVKNIAEISRIQGEINATNFSIEDRKQLVQQSQSESAHYSTRIEGNTLTLKQVTTALESSKKQKNSRELKEIINYAKTRQFLLRSEIQLNEKNLLGSHDILLSGILIKSMRGKYRKQQNVIKDSKTTKIVYLPPEWQDVPGLMKNLFKSCSQPNLAPSEAIINSGLFHFHFESIHPFLDGNGRLGRLWSSNLLKNQRLDFVELSALEKYHEAHRKEYYERLHFLQGDLFYNISSTLDLTPWLEYWTKGLLFSAQEALSRLREVPSSNEDLILETRLTLAIGIFRKHKKLSAEQYQLLTNLGRTQAVDDLNKLLKLKVIKKVGGGRSTVYLAVEK